VSPSGPSLGGRREDREEALSFLYETEMTGTSISEALSNRDLPPEDFALLMIEGVVNDSEAIDAILSANLHGWRLQRMAIVDRVIARMATWELMSTNVPTGAALSEAVELATQYCGEESPRFLNGVLRSVANELRPNEA